MPGRKKKVDLTGFQAPTYGDRAQLEEIAAAGGDMGGGGGAPPAMPAEMGGGMGGEMPSDMGGAIPFSNPFYDESGELIPDEAMQGMDDILPDDPDLPLRILMKAAPHPDLARLIDSRSGPSPWGGIAPSPPMEMEPELPEMGMEEDWAAEEEALMSEGMGAGLEEMGMGQPPVDPALAPAPPSNTDAGMDAAVIEEMVE